MYKAIHDLYLDNLLDWTISPWDTDYARQREAVERVMNRLELTLDSEQAKMLSDTVFEVCLQLGLDREHAFIQGFRAGVRLTAESLV